MDRQEQSGDAETLEQARELSDVVEGLLTEWALEKQLSKKQPGGGAPFSSS